MLHSYRDAFPVLAPTARVAENATLIGGVNVEDEGNIWFGAVLRADHSPIFIGARSNVQDNCVLHAGENGPIRVGRDVTIGHAAILHSCTVEDGSIVGMGATVMDGAVVGAGSLVAAGALVTKNTVIPPHSLVMGRPAKVIRPLTEEEIVGNAESAPDYLALSAEELPLIGKVER